MSREALEARLRDAVTSASNGGSFDDIELEHLIRVVSRCSVLLGDIYARDTVGLILTGDPRRAVGLIRELPPPFGRLPGSAVPRVPRLPDDVRVVADKCLFDLGMSGLERIHGILLADLGPRAYRLASELLELLATDPALRDQFLGNQFGGTLAIEEEVGFLRRCADKFPVYAELLRKVGVYDDPRGVMSPHRSLVPAPSAALAPVSVVAGAEPPTGAEAWPEPDSLAAGPTEDRDQLLASCERMLLFSTLDAARLKAALKWRVVDQDEAVETLCDEFALYAAGTQAAGKPTSYFLVGPTGVGKNLLVESLVQLLESVWAIRVPFLTIEGPNYTYPSDINELRGATRGFIRSDEKGILSEFEEGARGTPLAVILVDEVEKAHPQLRKFFLSIMDRGTTTDAHGKILYFGNTLLFFTSNVGYRERSEAQLIGFGGEEAAAEAYQAELTRSLKRLLSPEFINRLRIVHFRHLSRSSIEKIFDLEFERIASRFRDLHGIELVATSAAKQMLIARGYSHEYGARHLAGVLNDLCNVSVSRQIRSDDRRDRGRTEEALAYLREMREGERSFDADQLQARVRRAARADVDYDQVVVDAEGERIVYRPRRRG
jgi:hypothetical protein